MSINLEDIKSISKRNFLEKIGMVAGSTALYTAMSALDLVHASAQDKPPLLSTEGKGKTVLILGAGLSGLVTALELSKKIGNISKQDCLRVSELLHRANIDTAIKKPINSSDLYECMMGDKKKRGNVLNLIVLENLGQAKLTDDIDESLILEVIDSTL